MRDLIEAASEGDAAADLAVRAFCYRVKKYIGAYLAVLGGADAIVFGGGIGENSAEVRRSVCRGLEWAGLRLDGTANAATGPDDRLISSVDSPMQAWIVHVDEAIVIASDVASCLVAS